MVLGMRVEYQQDWEKIAEFMKNPSVPNPIKSGQMVPVPPSSVFVRAHLPNFDDAGNIVGFTEHLVRQRDVPLLGKIAVYVNGDRNFNEIVNTAATGLAAGDIRRTQSADEFHRLSDRPLRSPIDVSSSDSSMDSKCMCLSATDKCGACSRLLCSQRCKHEHAKAYLNDPKHVEYILHRKLESLRKR